MSASTSRDTPWERTFDKIYTPFEEFIHDESSSGLVLMACAVIALALANSPLAQGYEHILDTAIGVSIGSWTLEHSLHHWINDGLMTLFFFVVGLEIKREVLVGELADPRQAVLPIIAAFGGMLVPASIYAALNLGGPGIAGWGIPMATDIAFAIGVLVLLGRRVPGALMTFLVALAIVDDLGAVLVIALFYTEQLAWQFLGLAGLLLLVLIGFNLLGVRKPAPYFIVGLFLWLAMLESGVHATLAGILTAWTIPASSKFEFSRFRQLVRELVDRFEKRDPDECVLMSDENQRRALMQTLENGVHMAETPLQRLEHRFHLPVAFLVIPLFALANAGVPIDFDNLGEVFTQPISLGIVSGLIGGKFVGVGLFSLIAIKLGWGQLPSGTRVTQILGVGLLAGIGFTMSIFVAELGFAGQQEQLVLAKTGVLFASVIAGVLGYLWLLATSQSVTESS